MSLRVRWHPPVGVCVRAMQGQVGALRAPDADQTLESLADRVVASRLFSCLPILSHVINDSTPIPVPLP